MLPLEFLSPIAGQPAWARSLCPLFASSRPQLVYGNIANDATSFRRCVEAELPINRRRLRLELVIVGCRVCGNSDTI